MSIKSKLKERLLEIPIRNKAYREGHRLSDDIDEEFKKVNFYLNELCELGLLKRKIVYICPNCNETTILDNELLIEVLDNEKTFLCDNCENEIDPNKNVTKSIYYDVLDYELLRKW